MLSACSFRFTSSFLLDAVAGPDGEDATLLQQTFQPYQTSAEMPKTTKKITIGLPDVRKTLLSIECML